MTSSQLKANARESLKGKWGKSALITLVNLIIIYIISFVLAFIPLVGPIASYIISLPLSYGLIVVFIKLKRGEEVSCVDFLNFGFSKFGKVWSVFGNMILKLIVPAVLLVVSIIIMVFGGTGGFLAYIFDLSSISSEFFGLTLIGTIGYIVCLIYLVIKGFLYSLSFYILNDTPDKTGREIVEESAKLMKGNRWNFFWLGLTFIGWSILATFTFGIGLFWLMPYIQVTYVAFYESLIESTPITEN